jgi:D-alanyl-D-alanine carboxypeptidase (penicillin-binding protein 5/6)
MLKKEGNMKKWFLGLTVIGITTASIAIAQTETTPAAVHATVSPDQTASSNSSEETHPPASNGNAKSSLNSPSSEEEFKAPLNKLGAVDVNANVPYELQVPPSTSSTLPEAMTTGSTTWPNRVPTQPILNAKSYILIDATSGQILAADKANDRLPPASITKLMLLYVLDHSLVNKDISLDQTLTVPTIAWATGGSRMFLKPNETVKLQDLISGIIVDSGNDAAVTVATTLAGTQEAFVAMMNHQAQLLGMDNTHYTDVMGLPAPGHYTTARDLAVLGSRLLKDYPQFSSWYSQKSFTYNGITQENFNKLLFIYPYAIGLKTGSTNSAGYSLVSAAQKPGNPMLLVAAVLGTGSRDNSANESKALLEYGFRNFETVELYKNQQKVTVASVPNGETTSIPVGVNKDFYVTFPAGSQKNLIAQVELIPNVTAPVQAGQILGNLVIKLDGKIATTTPVVALKDLNTASVWQKIGRKVQNWI